MTECENKCLCLPEKRTCRVQRGSEHIRDSVTQPSAMHVPRAWVGGLYLSTSAYSDTNFALRSANAAWKWIYAPLRGSLETFEVRVRAARFFHLDYREVYLSICSSRFSFLFVCCYCGPLLGKNWKHFDVLLTQQIFSHRPVFLWREKGPSKHHCFTFSMQ